jgi:hypothetical protein
MGFRYFIGPAAKHQAPSQLPLRIGAPDRTGAAARATAAAILRAARRAQSSGT